MNKTITYIASVVTVLGLGTAYALGYIDGTGFGTISVAVLGTLFGLYKNFETNRVKSKLLVLEDKLFDAEFETTRLKNVNVSLVTAVKESNARFEDLSNKKAETPVVIEPVIEKEVPVTKTRKRK